MGIIVENHDFQAVITLREGALDIAFGDPSYVRCEAIVINPENRHIGGVLHEGYHDFGVLPGHIPIHQLQGGSLATLSGFLSSGQAFCLSAPVSLSPTR